MAYIWLSKPLQLLWWKRGENYRKEGHLLQRTGGDDQSQGDGQNGVKIIHGFLISVGAVGNINIYIYNLIYNVRVEICVNNWKYHGDTLDLDDRRPLPSKPPTASSTPATAATAFATYKNKAGQGCSTKLPSDSCHHLQISTVCVKIWTESIDINCTKIPGFSHNTL